MEENLNKQEEVKEEVNPQEEQNDNFKRVDPNIGDPKVVSVEDFIELQRTLSNLPADRLKAILQFVNEVSQGDKSFSYREYFKSDTASRVAVGSRYMNVPKGVYADSLDKNEFDNSVSYGDKNIGLRTVELGDKVDSKTAVARFTKFIDAGEIIQVPLWHSGFWVTIKPFKQKDFINLEQEVGENHVSLGRETTSLIYSNYGVIVNRIICNFIARHITEYTVKLPDTENVFDYINIQDLNVLILAILSTVFPKGLEYTKACSNNLKSTDGVKACNNILHAKLDPKKLLFVNRQALSKDMLDHMAMRRPNSVSLDAVKEYQRKIKELQPMKISILDGKVDVVVENPSVNKYIDVGEKWVEAVIKETEDLLTENADLTAKNSRIEKMVSTMLLGIYNSYVKAIISHEPSGDITYTDPEVLDSMLDRLSEVDETVKPFMDKMNEFITASAIAVVATPAYECPECKKSDKEITTKLKSGFENLVPLNMTYLFFDLGGSARSRYLTVAGTF